MNKVLVIGYPCRLCGCNLTKARRRFGLLGGRELSTRPDYTAAFETLVGPVRLGDGCPTAICGACRELLGSYVQTKATLEQICSEIRSKACETSTVTTDPVTPTTDYSERPAHQVRATLAIGCAAVGQIKTEVTSHDDGKHAAETSDVCPVRGSSPDVSQKTLSRETQTNTTPLKLQTPKCPDAWEHDVLQHVMFPKSCTPSQTQNPAIEKLVKVAVVTRNRNSKRTRILRGKWQSVGECLIQGRYQHVVRPLMAMPDVAPSVVNAVLELMKKECKELRNRGSVLKQTSASSLAEFEWDKVVEEWEDLAPTLLRFLKAACGMADSWKPETIADLDKENRMAMAGSILLNVRYPSMNAPLYVNGIGLYKAGVKRRTFTSLRRIGFCVDYGNILAKLRESAEGRLFVRKGHTGLAPASVVESTVNTEEQEKFEDHKERKTPDTEDEAERDYQRPLDSEAENLDPEPHSDADGTASSQSCFSSSQENSSDEEEEEELTEMVEWATSKKRRTDTETLDIVTALSRPFKVRRRDGDDET